MGFSYHHTAYDSQFTSSDVSCHSASIYQHLLTLLMMYVCSRCKQKINKIVYIWKWSFSFPPHRIKLKGSNFSELNLQIIGNPRVRKPVITDTGETKPIGRKIVRWNSTQRKHNNVTVKKKKKKTPLQNKPRKAAMGRRLLRVSSRQ